MVHQVKDLPAPYIVEPFTRDLDSQKLVVEVVHPEYGKTCLLEDGYIVEIDLGRKKILIPISNEKFSIYFDTYDAEQHQADDMVKLN